MSDDNRSLTSDSVELQYLQDGSAFNVEAVTGTIFAINGEENSGMQFNLFDDQSTKMGLTISMSIKSYDTATNTATVSFTLTVTDFDALYKWMDYKYSGDGSTSDPYYGEFTFYITSLLGEDGVEVSSDEIGVRVYAPTASSIVSELTVSPESNTMSIGGSTEEYTVYFTNIVPNSIVFVNGNESAWSNGYIYVDSWNCPSDKEDTSGDFTFSIGSTDEITTGSYFCTIKGRNSQGVEFEFPVEIIVEE